MRASGASSSPVRSPWCSSCSPRGWSMSCACWYTRWRRVRAAGCSTTATRRTTDGDGDGGVSDRRDPRDLRTGRGTRHGRLRRGQGQGTRREIADSGEGSPQRRHIRRQRCDRPIRPTRARSADRHLTPRQRSAHLPAAARSGSASGRPVAAIRAEQRATGSVHCHAADRIECKEHGARRRPGLRLCLHQVLPPLWALPGGFR
jgi:hypothetical protein